MSISIAPVISPYTVGPLGLCHLPRLWQKCLLAAHGQCAEGYKVVGPGFDHVVLDAIGVDREAVMPFFRERKPSYLEFEAWIREQPGVKLDAETIAAANLQIENHPMQTERRAELAQIIGLESAEGISAPMLVQLDSFEDFRKSLGAVS